MGDFSYKRVPDIVGKWRLVTKQGVEAQLEALGVTGPDKAKMADNFIPTLVEGKAVTGGRWRWESTPKIHSDFDFAMNEEYSYTWAGETYMEIATYKPDMTGMLLATRGPHGHVSDASVGPVFLCIHSSCGIRFPWKPGRGRSEMASAGNSWPVIALATSFSTTGPSFRQVKGAAFTVSWDFWGLQEGPHWVTGTLERHTCPGRFWMRCLRMVHKPVLTLYALATSVGKTVILGHISVSFFSSDKMDGVITEEEEPVGITQEAISSSGLE